MPLVIIPCGGRKLATDQPVPASRLYTGPYFRACLKFARKLTPDPDIRILSAKYGLIRLETPVLPYEMAIQPGAASRYARRILEVEPQLHGDRRVIGLCGENYARVVSCAWPFALLPLAGLGGIGYQLRWLANHDPAELRKYLERTPATAPPCELCRRCRQLLAPDFDGDLSAPDGRGHRRHPDGGVKNRQGAAYCARCARDAVFCLGCGCADDSACEGGCWWIGEEVCSNCGPGLTARELDPHKRGNG